MNRKKILIVAGLMLASSVCVQAVADAKKTVAVVTFRVNSNALKLGEHFPDRLKVENDTSLLAADLITALANNGSLDVVENARLEPIENEMKLKNCSMLELSTKSDMVGADYLVVGNVELVEAQKRKGKKEAGGIEFKGFIGRYVVNLRIIEVKKSKIVYANNITFGDSVNLSEDVEMSPLKFVKQLQEGIVRGLVNAIVETIYPIKVVGVESPYVYINRDHFSKLEKGMILDVLIPNRVICNLETGEIIGSTEYKIGQIRISEILTQMFKAQILMYSMKIEPGAICRTLGKAGAEGDASSELLGVEAVNWN